TDEVQISTGEAGKHYVSVYTMDGAAVSSYTFDGNSAAMPLDNLAHGMYLIGISNDGTNFNYKRIVKE
ncbi:MAG: T9SS type A sorting domain-containing protein, partial [Bacteroidia bacterium]|nr:T9SS type A sorting domain-containing protein [Bacteroidia bacterium]